MTKAFQVKDAVRVHTGVSRAAYKKVLACAKVAKVPKTVAFDAIIKRGLVGLTAAQTKTWATNGYAVKATARKTK